MNIKRTTVELIKSVLGPRNVGRLDYLLRADSRKSWGGAFNGQIFRQRIFQDVIRRIPFEAIVETGAHWGTTTIYLADSGLRVYTVENDPRSTGFSSMRFFFHGGKIRLYEGDSRVFLRKLADDPHFPKSNIFFYLDAHWGPDLPLREELEIIFGCWREAVVMIDDFQIPGTDYKYDDYGSGNTLNMSYIKKIMDMFGLSAFFPNCKSSEETGEKRGCIVLCREEEMKDSLTQISTLIPELSSEPKEISLLMDNNLMDNNRNHGTYPKSNH